MFDKNVDFSPTIRFSTNIAIFAETFDFSLKFRFTTKIAMFDENDFIPKLRFLAAHTN